MEMGHSAGSGNHALERAISEGYNFAVMEVIQSAFGAIKGLKFKFFLASLIMILIGGIFVSVMFWMMPKHQDMLLAMQAQEFSLWNTLLSLAHGIINILLTAGLSLIVLRHIRQQNNPLLAGLFSFFPLAGRVILIAFIVMIFAFVIPITMISLVALMNSPVLGMLVMIAMLLLMLGIGLLYSFTFFIMADYPTMGFWQVLESSRKLVMHRLIKMLIFYIIFMIALFIFYVIVMFLSMLVISPFVASINLFTVTSFELFLYLLLPYLPIMILSLWLAPFIWLVHGMIYLNLINDPSVKTRMATEKW